LVMPSEKRTSRQRQRLTLPLSERGRQFRGLVVRRTSYLQRVKEK
jgi:hypothetical protein